MIPIFNTGYLRASSQASIVVEHRPDVDGFFKLAAFRTNGRGLRDREYPLAKPPETFRVAVAGSSFSLPAGVEIEDAYHSLLEERLSAAMDRKIEFLNFSVGAFNTVQILATLRLRALEYQPDLVLFSITRLSAQDLYAPWDMEAVFHGFPPRTHAFFDSFLVQLVQSRRGVTRDPERGPIDPQAWEEPTVSVIEKLGAFRRAFDVPIVVALLEFDTSQPEIHPALPRDVRANGLHWLDTREAFAGTRASDFWIYELDPHPDARAHAIFADAVEAFLRAEQLLPE